MEYGSCMECGSCVVVFRMGQKVSGKSSKFEDQCMFSLANTWKQPKVHFPYVHNGKRAR